MNTEINGYTLVNEEKLVRVIGGSMGREGRLRGGIGENADPSDVLANYDRLGGLIRKGAHNIKMGAFWDFTKNKKREVPIVQFVFRDIEGKEVLVDEDGEIPMEVKAAEAAKSVKKVKKPRKAD